MPFQFNLLAELKPDARAHGDPRLKRVSLEMRARSMDFSFQNRIYSDAARRDNFLLHIESIHVLLRVEKESKILISSGGFEENAENYGEQKKYSIRIKP